MEDETVNIQIQSPSSDIVVDLGTTIILNTGSSNGVAELSGDGSAARNHDFTYTILEGHTSASNTDGGGSIDGFLEVIDISPGQTYDKNNNDLVDTQVPWITSITDVAGNYMPLLQATLDDIGLDLLTDNVPLANQTNSLDDLKSIRIDACLLYTSPSPRDRG